MMFLFNNVAAQVEPVPGKTGWFQLTGRDIKRWSGDVGDHQPYRNEGVVKNPKILGIHDFDEDIERHDPRFNHENGTDAQTGDTTFFVVKLQDGTYRMHLAVNRAEHVLLRFLCPHVEVTGDTELDPIDGYRLDAPTGKTKAAA